MNKLLAILLFGTTLTGCLFLPTVIDKKTQLYITRQHTGFYQQAVIIKNGNKNNPYKLWENGYPGDGFGDNPPSTLAINYAIIPWEKDRAWSMGLDNYIKLQAEKLPPSAWRTYKVNLKPVQDEVNRLYRTDPRGTYKFGAKATITLYIDGNGNVSQKVDYDRVTKGWLL